MLNRIEAYLATTGTSETRFGRTVAGDPRLVADLRRGRSPRPALVARIEAVLKGASA